MKPSVEDLEEARKEIMASRKREEEQRELIESLKKQKEMIEQELKMNVSGSACLFVCKFVRNNSHTLLT